METKQHAVRKKWLNDEIKEEIRKYLKTNDDENTILGYESVSSVAQSCPTICGPMKRSTSGLPVHHPLPEFTQTHVHRVGDAIQPSHPLSFPFPPAPQSFPASESFPMSQLFA